MNDFYIYVYLDPRKPGKYQYNNVDVCFLYEPFYIGKGKDQRLFAHLRMRYKKVTNLKISKIKAIYNANEVPIVFKLKENMNELDAVDLEIDLIKKIGRVCFNEGSLTNMVINWQGYNTKKINSEISEEHRKKISKSLKKRFEDNPEIQKKKADKFKKTYQIKKQKGLTKSPFKGKKHSEEWKQTIGEKLTHSSRNSGNVWVINPVNNEVLKIKKEELQTYLDKNYIKGRKIKNNV